MPKAPNASATEPAIATDATATNEAAVNSATGISAGTLGGGGGTSLSGTGGMYGNNRYGGGYGGYGGMGGMGYGGMGYGGMGGMGMGGMYGRGMYGGGMGYGGQPGQSGAFFEKAQMYIYQLCDIANMVEYNANGLAGFFQMLKNVSTAGYKVGKEWLFWLMKYTIELAKNLKKTLISQF